ncbi:hypothetical protein WJX73_002374 [Symbiochloris irregularis]|uniref:CNH domain-containing protein n=1 Tax=Symbiochloris irregularis TaxID=706552 RepID=A0AAW1P7X8_9CHLO
MRTAFQAWLAHEHQGDSNRISAVAVSERGSTLYLGLSDGQLEEYKINSGPDGVWLSLEARKTVGKQPIISILHIAAARRLVLLCDGLLYILDQDSLEGQALPGVKGATAVAPLEGLAAAAHGRMAVAMRSSRRSVRIMVFEVLAGADVSTTLGAAALCEAQAELAEPLAVKGMAWMGSDLVVCTALRAMLLQLPAGTYTQIFALPSDSPSALLVQAIPDANQALLLVDQAGVFVNALGQPTGTALTFPTAPGAIMAAGEHVLAACSDAMHIYNRATAAHVQSLPWLEGTQPNPGQRLLAASDPSGSCICLAGLRKVWLYMPVALEEQVQQVLQAGNLEQALALASAGAANDAPWAETAFAETAFLLLHELSSIRRAKHHIAEYLLQVRGFQGIEALEGVDTLAVHLLTELGGPTKLEALLAGRTSVKLASVGPLLEHSRQWHGLALLHSARGEPRRALDIWQDLAERRKESLPASTSGRTFEETVALATWHSAALLADAGAASESVVMQYLPWLVDSAPQHASTLLKARPLNVAEVLALLRERSLPVLCEYLDHVVVHLASRDPALHTELIMQLSHAALQLMPSVDHSLPAWERARLRRSGSVDYREGTQQSAARTRLLAAMQACDLWDARKVLQLLRGSELWQERVMTHQKLGEHDAALRVLALDVGDIRGAEAYCEQHAGPLGGLALLRMLLAPGQGRAPLYAEACHLLASRGAELDPQEVLGVMGPDMPLPVAVPTLERMLRERTHRTRQTSVLKNLHRACHLSAAAERAELKSKRVTVTEERACHLCHARLGTQVFAAYPNGTLAVLQVNAPAVMAWNMLLSLP